MRGRLGILSTCVCHAVWLAGALSCGGTTGEPIIAGVTVNPPTYTIVGINNTVRLTASVQGKLGAIDNPSVTWTSSSPNVVSISGSGVEVIATAKAAGSSVITASSGGQSGSATVTVQTIPVVTLSIGEHVVSLAFGGTKALTAQAYDAGGLPLVDRTITWLSRNSTVATVSGAGLVTGMGSGTTTIVATCEGKSDSASVTVGPAPVNTVTVSPSTTTVVVAKTTQLQATLKDAAGNTLTGRSVVWSSSNNAIATVSNSGLVTGVVLGGPVTITATSEDKSGTASVTVVPVPIASISISPPTATVGIGTATTLNAIARDSSGNVLSGRAFTWTSGDNTIATVSSTGSVTGVKVGTVTINASAENVTGSASVTVQATVPTATVTLQASGTGSGSVTSSPAGLNCTLTSGTPSGTCTITVAVGTVVTLSASPGTGLAFGGWTGPCSGVGNCQFTANSNVTVGYSFVSARSLLTVVNAGTGSGTVSLSPGYIGCVTIVFRATCYDYPTNTTVSLSAAPSAGSTFTGWSGACASAGLSPNCSILVSGSTTVTANWTLQIPTATTNPATAITTTSGQLNGCVSAVSIATQVWFEWGTTTALGSATAKANQATDNVSYCWSATIGGLVHGTTYYFRILASNANGQANGSILSFTP